MAVQSQQPRSATVYTVAERAGLSHQTVARYLRGEKLRPHNQEAVEQALKELDYKVNESARALATKRSQRIGAFVFDVDDWAPQRIVAGAVEAARASGYILDMIRVHPQDPQAIQDALRLVNRTQLAGVVVISPSDPILQRFDLERLRAPWIIEQEPELAAGDGRAHHHPFALGVRHLIELGHERFFHIGGPTTWVPARNRRQVYRDLIAAHGLRNCGETAGDWTPEAGYAAMQHYPLDEAPTALVAASDQIALGALFWLHERGIKVPDDVSITGFDGIADTGFYWPPLTTVAVDFYQMGVRVVEALLAHPSPQGRPDLPLPQGQLRARTSSGRPGRGIPPR